MRAFTLGLLFLAILVSPVSGEVSDRVLRKRIKDLHNDEIQDNCKSAMAFLRKHVEEPAVKKALLDEFYSTNDAQAKEECMVLLCHSQTFQPDEQFMRAVLKRMHHYGKPSELSSGEGESSSEPAGNAGALLIARQANKFTDLILAEIRDDFVAKDNGLWFQYTLIRALAKGHVLDPHADRFSRNYLKRLAENLQDDKIDLNARVAMCAFVFLSKIGVSTLSEVPQSSNLQGRHLALVILSYVSGQTNLRTFGSQLNQLGYFDMEREDLDDFDPEQNSNDAVCEGPRPKTEEDITSEPQ
jgi:hypothetical protein